VDKLGEAVKIAPMSKVNRKLAVKRTNTGLGLFTLEPIPADKRIIEYLGPILTNEEADQKGGKYLLTLDKKYIIDGSPRHNKARYINHSCRPNARAYTSGLRVWIWSLRGIKAGEEITIHYGKAYMDMHIERCKCRKCEARADNTTTKVKVMRAGT
jgi:SET domain-containing protein